MAKQVSFIHQSAGSLVVLKKVEGPPSWLPPQIEDSQINGGRDSLIYSPAYG